MKKSQLFVLGAIVFLSVKSYAATLNFWDANGSSPGATTGGGTATGTWGVDPYWTEDGAGQTATTAWTSGNHAVFAAGNDAFGAYTVTVQGTQSVADIHVDLGEVTFQGGTLNLDAGGVRLLSVGHKSADTIARYNTILTGGNGIIRYKQGIMIFGATNTYTGSTIIEGGILRLGVPNAIPSGSSLVLANNDTTRGDFNPVWQYTPASFETGGLNQQLGTLKFSGSDPSVQRIIDFGNGASALSFADSSSEVWDGYTLTVVNYTPASDSLRFGNSSTGLTPTQLAAIQFTDLFNLPAQIDSNGYATPALPVFLSVHRTSPTDVELTWSAVSGHNYRVQYKGDINDLDWTDLPFDVFAGDSTASYTDTTASGNNRFYRIQVLN